MNFPPPPKIHFPSQICNSTPLHSLPTLQSPYSKKRERRERRKGGWGKGNFHLGSLGRPRPRPRTRRGSFGHSRNQSKAAAPMATTGARLYISRRSWQGRVFGCNLIALADRSFSNATRAPSSTASPSLLEIFGSLGLSSLLLLALLVWVLLL